MQIAEYDPATGKIIYREETAQEIADREAWQAEGEKEEQSEQERILRSHKPLKKGEYFYLNGNLCKAKTAIASGALLTLNTNYQVTSVENELSILNV